MFTFIDNLLDRITMYRLVLYFLIGLLCLAVFFGFTHQLPYSPASIILSTGLLLGVGLVTNVIFASVFEAPTNIESVYITTLILALIISPMHSYHNVPFLVWAGILSMASKYILAVNRKHIFNPVAIAVVLTAFWLDQAASWWVGTTIMMPFVLVGGLLIVRKIQREDMVTTFILSAIGVSLFLTFLKGGDMYTTVSILIFKSSLLFFAFIMLTEPLTTPPTKKLQMLYGGLVGVLFSPSVHIGSVYMTPELALVIGNIFSYLVSPKQKVLLFVEQKLQYGSDIIHFVFHQEKPFTFSPGQYLEWTLPHKKTDSRGNRRYFTIASSPTEKQLHLGVKFYSQGSSYKKALAELSEKTPILAGQLAGDFTLPTDEKQKLVFIAGGIGITPFRSMIKYIVDTNQQRNIVLLYANKVFSEIAYADVFESARKNGVNTIYTLTDQSAVPSNWKGSVGRITPEMIAQNIPDFMDRTFYLSGPHAMITAYEKILNKLGVSAKQIKKDFFPGFV